MVDVFPKKLEGEGMDYNHSSIFLGDPKIEYDSGNEFINILTCSFINIY